MFLPLVGFGGPKLIFDKDPKKEKHARAQEAKKSENADMKICCKCGKNNVWRIELRDCHHVICVPCGVVYMRWAIMDTQKARIKCPKKKCVVRIHENDVAALLDLENDDLTPYMPKEHREWLLFKHDTDVVVYGLGGKESAKYCPICMNYYAPEAGCHMARCPNIRCATWFCTQCNKPVKSWQHFTLQSGCMVGADDLYKLTYFVRFLLQTEGFVMLCVAPIVQFLLIAVLPFGVCCGIPYVTFRKWHRNLHENNRKPTDMEMRVFILKCLFLGPLVFVFACIVSPCSLFFSVPIFMAYIGFAICKSAPPFDKLFEVIDIITLVLGILGLGDLKKIIQDTKNARNDLEVERKQAEQEKSEEIKPENMNSVQLELKAAKEKATAARVKKGYNLEIRPELPF